MSFVGPDQLRNLLSAVRYYKTIGYQYMDVPWCVSQEAIDITSPPHYYLPNHYSHPHFIADWKNEPQELHPVASAEQSFLQVQLDFHRKSRNFQTGTYCALTPCFRNEPVIDALHLPCFMKVELIDWSPNLDPRFAKARLAAMMDAAQGFFNRFVETTTCENNEPDPLAVDGSGYDILTEEGGIELGSYGIRTHPKVGTWVYGTGAAEPRLSYAIEETLVGGTQAAGSRSGPPSNVTPDSR